jgi:hypothetical protein
VEVTDDLRRYLDGEEFSSGLAVEIASRREPVHDRVAHLSELVRGRRVVHVGCVDHLPLLDDKIERGIWLHGRLAEAAERCVGVDINREGIERLRTVHGRTDVVAADITADDIPEIDGLRWDCFLLADVVEHLDAPVQFLRAVVERHGSRFDELIVTVPNALCDDNRRAARRGREVVNTDHRFWFTPYTIAKVARRAGLDPRWIRFAEFRPTTAYGRLRHSLRRRRFGARGDTLVVGMAPPGG